MSKRKLALLGDSSTHGGSITNSNTDGTVKAEGKEVCVSGAILNCPIHGAQPITGNLATKTKANSKLLVLNGSIANCGAVVIASTLKTYGS